MEDADTEANIRKFEAMTEEERAQYRLNPRFRRLNFCLWVSGFMIAAGVAGVLAMSAYGFPVEGGALTAFSARYSLPLLALFLLFALPSMRARTGWDKGAGLLFLMATAGFLLCGAAAARMWDYAADPSAPARYEAVVTDRHYSCSHRGWRTCHYYVDVTGGPRGVEYSLEIPEGDYRSLARGQRYALFSSPGALGFEWLHAYCPAR